VLLSVNFDVEPYTTLYQTILIPKCVERPPHETTTDKNENTTLDGFSLLSTGLLNWQWEGASPLSDFLLEIVN
jgi:hypothetical protein